MATNPNENASNGGSKGPIATGAGIGLVAGIGATLAAQRKHD